jgi:hypothetical protein
MFTTEEQMVIDAPSVPTETSGLYIDGGAFFGVLFLGKQKGRKKKLRISIYFELGI